MQVCTGTCTHTEYLGEILDQWMQSRQAGRGASRQTNANDTKTHNSLLVELPQTCEATVIL